jgi:lysosomal-associated membrane protein 1/2
VNISLPASAEVLKNGSSCGKENVSDPSLTITFGRGYLLTLNFTKNTTRYSVQHMYFTYNLSDTEHFPNAISKGKTSVKNANLKGRVKNLPFREPHECPLCPLPF